MKTIIQKEFSNKFIKLSYIYALSLLIISSLSMLYFEYCNLYPVVTGMELTTNNNVIFQAIRVMLYYTLIFVFNVLIPFSHYYFLPVFIILSYYMIKNNKFKLLSFFSIGNFILQVFYNIRADIINSYEGYLIFDYVYINGPTLDLFLIRFPTILLAIVMCYLYLKEEEFLHKSKRDFL